MGMFRTALGGSLILATSAIIGPVPSTTTGFAPGFGNQGSNWAGYVSTHVPFSEVNANWQEPAVTCNSTNDNYASWVGLDGWGSNTVEQTGVTADCSSGAPVYRVWYERWPQEQPVWLSPQQYPVSPGDSIRAEVQHYGAYDYLELQDYNRNWDENQQVRAPANERDASAEVIVEAELGGHGFPNFGRVNFWTSEIDYNPFGHFAPFALDAVNGNVLQADTSTATNGGMTFSVHYDHE